MLWERGEKKKCFRTSKKYQKMFDVCTSSYGVASSQDPKIRKKRERIKNPIVEGLKWCSSGRLVVFMFFCFLILFF